tara:strand:- start:20893 stop:22200 length:1308 start_codon:yes stop_codon:yes gene_type:complete
VDKFKLNKLFDDLFPICRSITGNGYSRSLDILRKYINFKIIKYRSGKKVFDWVVPKEWNITDAYVIKNKKKIIDFKKNNLHILNFSKPVNNVVSLKKLQKHLYSLKKYPNLIPYATSYYQKNWGFCIKDSQRKKLKKGKYKVVIKSNFKKGYLRNGLAKLSGKTDKIFLISSYLCHPSMANNELSGPLVLTGLFNKIKNWKSRNLNYYFLINPETIGSICFINSHKEILNKKLESGLVLTCLGGPKKKISFKKSRISNSKIDKLFEYFSKKKKVNIRDFDPTDGSDERQYCSAENNYPIGQISRTVYGEYYQYHTSGDNKKFMNISKIEASINQIEEILKIYEMVFPLKRFEGNCELQLGKRGLYPNINSIYTRKKSDDNTLDNKLQLNILNFILSYADGNNDIIDLANVSGYKIEDICKVLKICLKKNLIIAPK